MTVPTANAARRVRERLKPAYSNCDPYRFLGRSRDGYPTDPVVVPVESRAAARQHPARGAPHSRARTDPGPVPLRPCVGRAISRCVRRDVEYVGSTPTPAKPSHFNLHPSMRARLHPRRNALANIPTEAEPGTGADLSSSRQSTHDDALNVKSPTSCAKRSGASR